MRQIIISVLKSKSDCPDTLKLAVSPENDLQQEIARKTNLRHFDHHGEPLLLFINMAYANPQETQSLHLGFEISNDKKWSDSIVRSAFMKHDSLCRARQFFSTESIFAHV